MSKGLTLIVPDGVTPNRQWAELALDPATGDIEVPPRWIYGAEAVVQRIYCRLRFWLGEWFLDQRQGVPWLTVFGKKSEHTGYVTALITRAIASTPGVLQVRNLRANFNRRERTFTVEGFEAKLADLTTVNVDRPFILGAQ